MSEGTGVGAYDRLARRIKELAGAAKEQGGAAFIGPSGQGAGPVPASSGHDHDEDYAPLVHDHDDRYYTEAEVDALIAAIPSGATRDLLTNGDLANPELVFANGDVIWVEES